MSKDATGHLLHNILNPPQQPGPPYTHTLAPHEPDPAEAVAWLREQIEGDKRAALIISNGGFAPERWDTEPPGQVNPERLTQAKAVDAVLGDDDPAFPLHGCWVALYAWERENHEAEAARVRASDLPAVIVNDGRREADHIRRHDPLNTVADCEAKLAILAGHHILSRYDTSEDYGEFSVVSIGGANKDHGCVICHYYGQGGVKGYGICWTVRTLAAAYRHRDGYARYWGDPVTHTLSAVFTCPRCGRTSHNPNDAREGYCGACHDWTGKPQR